MIAGTVQLVPLVPYVLDPRFSRGDYGYNLGRNTKLCTPPANYKLPKPVGNSTTYALGWKEPYLRG
jgi:hypothetical protein